MKAEVDSCEHSSSHCVSFNVFSFEKGSLNAFDKFLEKQAFLYTKRECRQWVVDVNCVCSFLLYRNMQTRLRFLSWKQVQRMQQMLSKPL